MPNVNANIVTGSITAANASVSATGSAAPASATYNGMLVSGGNMVGASGSVWGSAPSTLNVLGVNADVLSSALPTGASTSALQPAINGDGGALAHVTNFPATQPVSATSLPLPTGAATSANQPPVTSAGTTASTAGAIQGVTGGVPVPISGSITATFSQFAPNGNYSTPLNVTGTSSRAALPTGTTVAVYNTGSNAAFVQFGSSSVVATASDDQIAPGGFNCFAVGANVDIAAIETAGTTTLNVSGGTGGCAGSGGGGGASGGSSVFQATNFNEGTASSSTTSQVIASSGSTTIYLVNYAYQTDGGASSAGTFQIVSGTGTNCSTINQHLTPVWNFSANNGIQEGSIGVLGASSPGDELCVVTSTANKVNWRIGVAQQ